MPSTASVPITKDQLKEIINSVNTDHYFIQIPRGNLTAFFNHVAHGTIALYELGAGREQVDAYLKWYTSGLHKPQNELRTIPPRSLRSDETDMWKLLGQRAGYYDLLEYYKGRLASVNGSLDELLNNEFPKLMEGMVGGALHGLIHIGFGYFVASPQLVCEGLAFLHFAHFPLDLTEKAPSIKQLGHEGDKDILEIIEEIRQNSTLLDFWRKSAKEELTAHLKHKPWPPSQFQVKMAPLLKQKADLLADYVNRIKIPTFQYSASENNTTQLEELMKWVLDCVITLFLAIEKRNSFFLLHGVTGSWALSQFLGVFKNYDFSVAAVRTLLCILLAVYVEEECPAVDIGRLEDIDVSSVAWSDVLERVYQLPDDTDEHIYKLVHVCHSMGRINKDTKMDEIYRRAALLSMTHKLSAPDPIVLEN